VTLPLPSDGDLDIMIRTRLAVLGIDLGQLDPTTTNPKTGTPSQQQVLAALRSFMASTVLPLAAFQFPPAAPTNSPADSAALSQQGTPPQFYPSINTAWSA
jgi:hypothetical protein